MKKKVSTERSMPSLDTSQRFPRKQEERLQMKHSRPHRSKTLYLPIFLFLKIAVGRTLYVLTFQLFAIIAQQLFIFIVSRSVCRANRALKLDLRRLECCCHVQFAFILFQSFSLRISQLRSLLVLVSFVMHAQIRNVPHVSKHFTTTQLKAVSIRTSQLLD